GSACTAYHTGLPVNSTVSAWFTRVSLAVFASLSNVKVLELFPRIGRGKVSVTSMRLVTTGRMVSSPSEKLPALADIRITTALKRLSGTANVQTTSVLCCSARSEEHSSELQSREKLV